MLAFYREPTVLSNPQQTHSVLSWADNDTRLPRRKRELSCARTFLRHWRLVLPRYAWRSPLILLADTMVMTQFDCRWIIARIRMCKSGILRHAIFVKALAPFLRTVMGLRLLIMTMKCQFDRPPALVYVISLFCLPGISCTKDVLGMRSLCLATMSRICQLTGGACKLVTTARQNGHLSRCN